MPDRDLALRGQAQAAVSPRRRRALAHHRHLRRLAAAEHLLRAQGPAGQLARSPDRADRPRLRRRHKRFEKVFGDGEYVLVLVEARRSVRARRAQALRRARARRRQGSARHRQQRRCRSSSAQRPASTARPRPPASSSSSSPAPSSSRSRASSPSTCWRCRSSSTCRPPPSAPTSSTAIDRALAPYENHRRRSSPCARSASPTSTRTSTTTRARPGTNTSCSSCCSSSSSTGCSIDRSARSSPFVLTLGVSRGAPVGFVGVTGGTLHHRLVAGADDDPDHRHGDARLSALALRRGPDEAPDIDEHRSSRWPTSSSPATASIFATAVGFAALAV